ncbi:hypothetical protein D3C74_409890 [compost metagenome]
MTNTLPKMQYPGVFGFSDNGFVERKILVRKLDKIIVFDGQLHLVDDLFELLNQRFVIPFGQSLLSKAFDKIPHIIQFLNIFQIQADNNCTHSFKTD